jgi:hypothetical protein
MTPATVPMHPPQARSVRAVTDRSLRAGYRLVGPTLRGMPVEFLTDDEAAEYGRYAGVPSQVELEKIFFLDDKDRALVVRPPGRRTSAAARSPAGSARASRRPAPARPSAGSSGRPARPGPPAPPRFPAIRRLTIARGTDKSSGNGRRRHFRDLCTQTAGKVGCGAAAGTREVPAPGIKAELRSRRTGEGRRHIKGPGPGAAGVLACLRTGGGTPTGRTVRTGLLVLSSSAATRSATPGE